MTKVTGTIDVSAFSTDAKFRTWGSTCSAALASAGLVQTSDTGQINWTTVTKPVAANTKAGYEIWRFNDSLQATKPIYIRFDYGSSGVASGNAPATWITVGTGSNGSGTITGPSIPVIQGYNIAAAPTAVGCTYQFTHSTSNGYLLANFGMNLAAGNAASAGYYILERTKNSSGTVTGNGVGLTMFTSGLALRDMAINFDTLTAYTTQRNLHCGVASASYSLTSGTNVAYYRHLIGANPPYYASGRISFYLTDIPDASVFSASTWGGATKTYYAWSSLTGSDSSSNSAIGMAHLWED